MKILFSLPGFHVIDRGAEVALIAVATELANRGDEVTLIGSGPPRTGLPYGYLRARCLSRRRFERLPSVPFLRHEYAWEDMTFAPSLFRRYRPHSYDVTVTCNYPFSNFVLRRPVLSGKRPIHIFITENGDWPARSNKSEFRYFGCDGLICTNPDYYKANKDRWPCALIPNGIDLARFQQGPAERKLLDLPDDRPIVLMVSALSPSKRVLEGIEAVSRVPDCHMVVAGDGPLREEVGAHARALLPGRFTGITVSPDEMPAVYRSASLFLHMSLDEAFGNVFLEAMACGLPVVAHDLPRYRWIMGDVERFVDSLKIDDVAAAIVEGLKEQTPQIRIRNANVDRFNWPRLADQYRAFFSTILEMV